VDLGEIGKQEVDSTGSGSYSVTVLLNFWVLLPEDHLTN